MKYLLIGNYGATNIGDEAICSALIDRIKKRDTEAEISVLSYQPQVTKRIHDVASYYLFPCGFRSLFRALFKGHMMQTISAIRSADQIIFGGGGLFADEKIRAVLIWFVQVFVAHLFGKRDIIFYRQTVGPLNHWFSRFLTKKAAGYCNRVIVRDKESKNLLHFIGVNTVEIKKDPVLEWPFVKEYVREFYRNLDSPDVDEQFEIAPISGQQKKQANSALQMRMLKSFKKGDAPYIVVCIRQWHLKKRGFMKYIAGALEEYCLKYGYNIYFVPFQVFGDDDREQFRQLRSLISKKVEMVCFSFDLHNRFKEEVQLLCDLFLHAERVIAMRLHALIFAHLCRLDAVGIVYSAKVQSFVDSVGFDNVTTNTIDKIKNIL